MQYNFFRIKEPDSIFDEKCTFCGSTEDLKVLGFYTKINQNLDNFCMCENCRLDLAEILTK